MACAFTVPPPPKDVGGGDVVVEVAVHVFGTPIAGSPLTVVAMGKSARKTDWRFKSTDSACTLSEAGAV